MKCSLCGYNIDDKEVASCKECPLRRDCTIKKCPNCGYSLIDVSKIELLIDRIKRLVRVFNRRKKR